MATNEIILPFVGFFIGAFGTLLGIGGGIIAVSLLLLVYSLDSKIAVGTSLVMVFFNALSGTIAYIRQKRVIFKIAVPFSIATIPGAIGGIYLTSYVNTETFSILFGILLALSALSLIFGKDPRKNTDVQPTNQQSCYPVNMKIGIIISFFAGLIASFFGIGGGMIHVPCMILLLGIPVHVSTATSNFILTVTGLSGATTAVLNGYANINYALLLGAGAFAGAQVGANISLRIKGSVIIKLLALAMMLLAVKFIIKYP
ncbi:MAG: sulfite exporter TauE/SafE family protein [Planctomycetota bacterium]